MSERSNTVRFFLNSKAFGKERIEDIKDPVLLGGDTYSLEEGGYYKVDRQAKVTLYESGYRYILSVLLTQGPSHKVQLITEVKDDLDPAENWKRISDSFINLYGLNFSEESDNPSVECLLVAGGDLGRIEASFSDDFDTVGPNVPDLPFVQVRLDPRKIVKRSRFISSTITVNAEDDSGATARAVPLELDFTSERQYIGEVSNTFANSVGGNYATLLTSGNLIIQNAPRDIEYTLNGTVEIVSTRRSDGGYWNMDLVRYNNGEDRNFDEIILNMDSGSSGVLGEILTYTFVNYKLTVKEGDSIGIMTLSEGDDGGVSFLYLEYQTTENTALELVTETPFPVTYTKAVKPFDMLRHLARIMLKDHTYPFESSVFGPGGRHENKLLVHGTWLRNMPLTINAGEDDERRLQANVSLEDLYGAYSILEPLRYDVTDYKGRPTFTVGSFKDIQQNFRGIRIGEVTDKFRMVEVESKGRNVIGDNYYRKISLGSETSGSNYGTVNNLFSICGNAKWATPHEESKGEYEFLTDFRTGAEDIEIQRQFQYAQNPDIDGEYDDDWFLIDTKFNGVEYVTRGWGDFYSEQPTGVYSPETNYNWPFAPIELLRGHGYKINSAMLELPQGLLTDPNGNCTLSLETKTGTEPRIKSNEPFPVSLLDKARVRLLMLECETILNQEILDQLRGKTNGVDNKFGIIEIIYNGQLVKGRLFRAITDEKVKFSIIQAEI